MTARSSESVRAVRAVVRNPDLRRLQAAWALLWVADWAYLVALGIFAFKAGGSFGVGLAVLIRMFPSALVAPFASMMGDRYSRQRVFLGVVVMWSLALAASAVAFFGHGPTGLVYGLGAVTGLASTIARPTLSSLLPWLARSSEELVAANVVSSLIESVGTLVGPLLGGVITASAEPGAVFAASAGACLLAVIAIARMRTEGEGLRGRRRRPEGLAREAFGGFETLARHHDARLIVMLFSLQTLVRGALNVIIVVSALTLLRMGESGVGFLTAAVGAGGLVGSVVSFRLVGRRLAAPFGIGLILWGLPIVAIAVHPRPAVALGFLALLGAGNAVLDVAGFTLLQRSVPDQVLARVFGLFFGLVMATVGLGSIALPPLIHAIGIRWAMVLTGALLPTVTVLLWRRILRIDATAAAPDRELSLLRNVPMLAPLSVAAMEHLAEHLSSQAVSSGNRIIDQGDQGDRFYVVSEGQFEVIKDGRPVATLGQGDFFGEIALLREAPRSATVVALADSEVYTLERGEFIAAITGHSMSAEAATQIIEERLAHTAGR
ncbi:MAG TPA: MFS transporter [Actinomycetota bacterium]|nr:MFS transporter [Actinomycetota bacterium]